MTFVQPMTFVQAVQSGLRNFANFTGQATRREYWYFQLFVLLVGLVTSVLDGVIFPVRADAPIQEQLLGAPIGLVTSVLLFLPQLSMLGRRLRDAGFSAKWLFLYFVAAGFMALVFAAGIAVDQSGQAGTIEGDLNVIGYLYPAVMIAGGILIFFFVVTLQPTKTGSQGNKYAPGYDPTRDPKSDQFSGSDQDWQPKL